MRKKERVKVGNIEILSIKKGNYVQLVIYSTPKGIFEARIYETSNELKIDDEVYKIVKEKRFLKFIEKKMQQEIMNQLLQLDEYRVRNTVHPYDIDYMESLY